MADYLMSPVILHVNKETAGAAMYTIESYLHIYSSQFLQQVPKEHFPVFKMYKSIHAPSCLQAWKDLQNYNMSTFYILVVTDNGQDWALICVHLMH